MARMKRYKEEMEYYNNAVVDLVDSYTMDLPLEYFNLCFCDCLEQISYMRNANLISRECFDEHLIDLLHFYKMALSELTE